MLFEGEILTPGEKIKRLRKILKLKQKDICGKFSHTLVYIAESESKLTKELAAVITEKFNEKIHENNIDMDEISIDWLIANKDEQADSMLLQYRNEIHLAKMANDPAKAIENCINEINRLISNYEVNPQYIAEIYDYITEAYYLQGMYKEARKFAQNIYNIAFAHSYYEYILKAINHIIKVLLLTCKFEDIEMYTDIAKSVAEKHGLAFSENLKRIYYNTALSFNRLNKAKECMHYLKLLDAYDLTEAQLLDTMIIKGTSNIRTKNFKKAEEILLKVISEGEKYEIPNAIAIACSNMAYIKAQTNMLDESCKYIDLASKIKCNDHYYSLIMHECLMAAIKCKYDKFVAENYLKVIQCVVKLNEREYLIETVRGVFDYFKENSMKAEIEILLSQISTYILTNKSVTYPVELGYIFLIASQTFSEDVDKSKKYFNLCLEVQSVLNSADIRQ